MGVQEVQKAVQHQGIHSPTCKAQSPEHHINQVFSTQPEVQRKPNTSPPINYLASVRTTRAVWHSKTLHPYRKPQYIYIYVYIYMYIHIYGTPPPQDLPPNLSVYIYEITLQYTCTHMHTHAHTQTHTHTHTHAAWISVYED